MVSSGTIFQTWKTLTSMPPMFSESAATWREKNPEWSYVLYDHAMVWEWLRARERRFPGIIQNDREVIRTLDLFRYCYLLECGGMYADLDFVCFRSVSPLLDAETLSVSVGSVKMPAEDISHSIPNAWMYSSRPGHPLWLVVLALARERVLDDVVERATGPVLLRDAVLLYNSLSTPSDLMQIPNLQDLARRNCIEVPTVLPAVNVHAPEVLYPLSWGFDSDQVVIQKYRASSTLSRELLQLVPRTDQTYGFTYWAHSWERESPEMGY